MKCFSKRIILLFIMICCLFYSCKKDVDTVPPEIEVLKPVEGAGYSVNDKIILSVKVTDDNIIKTLKVQLKDQDMQPALGVISKTPDKKEFFLNEDYIIDNATLETAVYYLKITASDGVNESKEYVKLLINGVKQYSKGVIVMGNAGNYTDISLIDSVYAVKSLALYPARYYGSSVSSSYQYVNLSSSSGRLISLNTSNAEERWTRSYSSEITDITFGNELTFVGYEEGVIRGFNHEGTLVFTANSNNRVPVRLYYSNDYLIVHERQKVGQDKKLVIYYSETGALKDDVNLLNEEVVAYANKRDDEIYVLSNDSGEAKLRLFVIPESDNPYLWEPYDLPSGKVYDAVEIDNDRILIAHENAIYQYQYSMSSLTTFYNSPGVTDLDYNPVSDEVIAAKGSQVEIYGRSSSGGFLKESIHLTYPVEAVHVLNNK